MVEALIHSLAELGIRIKAEGYKLRVKVQKGRIPPALLDRIKANKPSILAYLRRSEADKYLRDNINNVVLGDCLTILKRLQENSVDLMVTDPPYGIKFMGKSWDKALPNPEVWKECLRVLKPGAFAFIMASPRQDVLARMVISLEDAGFKTGFTSIYWTYASGFPKAYNIGKAVARKNGAERKVLYEKQMPDMRGNNYGQGRRSYSEVNVQYTLPETKEAKQFDGSYAGFQPKPAVEVILAVMKPLDQKRYTNQALDNGKGITWLDDCLIPYGDKVPCGENPYRQKRVNGKGLKPQWQAKGGVQWAPGKKWNQEIIRQAHPKSRFPANLLVSDGVLDDGRNIELSKPRLKVHSGFRTKYVGGEEKTPNLASIAEYGDGGTYSRFFSLDAWADLNLKDLPALVQRNLPYLIVPKASPKEKNAGLDSLKGKAMGGKGGGLNRICEYCGVPQLKPYLCKCEKKSWVLPKKKNIHPTVKPIKLMTYLITMGSREGDIVLDPFAGSGSTLIAAQMLKRRFIGMEMKPEYHEIAVRRLAHHSKLMNEGGD